MSAEAAKPATGVVLCPLCKGRARRAMRPEDHDGKDYYCVSGCVEAGDNYYFSASVPF